VFVTGQWLGLEREGYRLTPYNEVTQLCDRDSPVDDFNRLELPPEGGRVERGERLTSAWRTNAFTGWRCDPGWSDCSECQIAEPVPLGIERMTICAVSADRRCEGEDEHYLIEPGCKSIEVAIHEHDSHIEVVFEQADLVGERCSGDGVLVEDDRSR
jgi:hypothetical protein